MKEMWDKRFNDKKYFYGLEPNPEFKSFIKTKTPGTILLPGEGEGRNAVYAATKGWEVKALDFSSTAKEKALQLARDTNTAINYDIVDLTRFEPKANTYDVVACIFLHLPSDQFKKVYLRLFNGLKKGGSLFIVGFHKDQLKHSSGGPKNEDWLFTSEQFHHIFNQYTIINAQDVECMLNEGEGHEGKAKITVVEIKK